MRQVQAVRPYLQAAATPSTVCVSVSQVQA
ncbi:hypothetical protein Hamer_G006035 [Homarus americanus]|uniref:Uncharacterized protein n=1 Tax=Homarus americanus TaxID=6706 RepID=A0A8J5JNI7_HOMAM|nr:hypothetical protein Hamer_G006035 [Homarus americanus]